MSRGSWILTFMAFSCLVHIICASPTTRFNELEDLLEKLKLDQRQLEGKK